MAPKAWEAQIPEGIYHSSTEYQKGTILVATPEIIEEQPWSIYGYAMRQQIVDGEKTEHFAIEVVSKVEKIEDGQYVLKFNILFNNGERHLSKYVGNVRQGDEFTKTTLTQDLTMETPGFGYLEYRGPSPMWNIKGVNRWSIRLYTDGIDVYKRQEREHVLLHPPVRLDRRQLPARIARSDELDEREPLAVHRIVERLADRFLRLADGRRRMNALTRQIGHAVQMCEHVGDLIRITVQLRVAAVGRRGRPHARERRRSHLAAGHAVNRIIDVDDRNAVAPITGMDRLAGPDRGQIAVALIGKHEFRRIEALGGRGDCGGPAVGRLDPVDVDIIVSQHLSLIHISFLGMWIATFILLPISVYLTYKATNDSNLFNAEWYLARYKKISAFFRSLFRRNALRGGLPPAGTAGSETR